MNELTERERKLVTIMLTIVNPLPAVKDQPQDVKEQLIKEAFRIRHFDFKESEVVEIINLITKESQITVTNLFGFLQSKGIDWQTLDFKRILQGKK